MHKKPLIFLLAAHTTGTVVRHLNADDAEVPLLEDWMPIFNYSTSDDEQKIADYTYLILATAQTLSTLISIGIIVLGVSYLLALLGIKKFERMVKE